jgi:hypothetical protein
MLWRRPGHWPSARTPLMRHRRPYEYKVEQLEAQLAEAKQNVAVLKADVGVATQKLARAKDELVYEEYQKQIFDRLAKQQAVRQEDIEQWMIRVQRAHATNDEAMAELERARLNYVSLRGRRDDRARPELKEAPRTSCTAEKRRRFRPNNKGERRQRPTGCGVISFPSLQRRDPVGADQWQLVSKDGASYPRSAERRPHGRWPPVHSRRRRSHRSGCYGPTHLQRLSSCAKR